MVILCAQMSPFFNLKVVEVRLNIIHLFQSLQKFLNTKNFSNNDYLKLHLVVLRTI